MPEEAPVAKIIDLGGEKLLIVKINSESTAPEWSLDINLKPVQTMGGGEECGIDFHPSCDHLTVKIPIPI